MTRLPKALLRSLLRFLHS